MRIPKVGDEFFTGFESDYGRGSMGYEMLTIAAVEHEIRDEQNREGRCITASDGVGYDCFWSSRCKHFVYALDI